MGRNHLLTEIVIFPFHTKVSWKRGEEGQILVVKSLQGEKLPQS